MRCRRTAPFRALALLALLAGCGADLTAPPPVEPTSTREARRPAAAPPSAAQTDISWDTERDRRFAEFIRDKASSMIKKAAVGIERRGRMDLELTEAVAPEDTLDLTKSLVSGARKDFPDTRFDLRIFDPSGAPILKAHADPERGVRYEIVHDEGGGAAPAGSRADSAPARDDSASARGRTERDQKFAAWAEQKASRYLRYVEADLDRRGQLWIGITRDVEPGDVRPLVRSLLEGARTEFPDRELSATVFDPTGGRIGKAVLGRDGQVRWSE